MKKRILLISLMLVLMIPVGLFGLMNSETGSRWLLQSIFSSLPTKASVKTIEGRLLERIVLSDLYYQSDTGTIAIKNLVFVWQPSKLFSGTLKIVDITLEEVTVSLAETTSPAAESSFDLNAELRLPVQIVIENLLVTNLSFSKAIRSNTWKNCTCPHLPNTAGLTLSRWLLMPKPWLRQPRGKWAWARAFHSA